MTPRKGVRPGDYGRRGTFRDRFGQAHTYHSSYELRRMRLFDAAGYRWRREPARIPYLFAGRRRIYRPDFAVWDAQGNKLWIEEVKPGIRVADPQNQAKWRAALHWCRAAGWRFRVITEAELGQP